MLAFLSLLAIIPLPHQIDWLLVGIMDLLHLPSFFLLCCWLNAVLDFFDRKKFISISAALCISISAAVGLEILHHFIGRESSLSDFWLSLSGVFLASIYCSWPITTRYWIALFSASAWFGMLIFKTYSLWHPVFSGANLGNFEYAIGLQAWKDVGQTQLTAIRSQAQVHEGNYALAIFPQKNPWTGVTYQNLLGLPRAKYQGLSGFFYSPIPTTLFIRIDQTLTHNQAATRIDLELPLQIGWNSILLNFNEPIFTQSALTRIKKIAFFVETSPLNTPFYLDAVQLL